MSSTGTTTRRSHSFSDGGATTSTGPTPPRNRATSSTGRTVAERPIRCAGCVEQLVEPLERERQVGAALGAGDGVHLVEDHRLHAPQRLAGLRGEHQEQRLGGGDQDVGRGGLRSRGGPAEVSPERTPTRDVGLLRSPSRVGGVPDAGQRRPQVALDVDRERLERRDVEHPAAELLASGSRRGRQPVDRPQEGAERLAGPGRRDHQRVAARGDRVPGADLRGRRLGERSVRTTSRVASPEARAPEHPARRHRHTAPSSRGAGTAIRPTTTRPRAAG